MARRIGAMVVLSLLIVGCTETDEPEPEVMRPRPTAIEPTPAAELHIALDPEGRPYDAQVHDGRATEQRPLRVMNFPDGLVQVIDGIQLWIGPDPDLATPVDFGENVDLEVSIIWTLARDGHESPLGVRLDVPGAEVQQWARFETAYATDGGLGGVTTTPALEHVQARIGDEWLFDEPNHDVGYDLLDYDQTPGADTLLFSNGWGDGAFPMSRGLDVDDGLVSLVIWSPHHPWRLAVPDGVPPPDVTEREDQLLACIEGRRPFEIWDDRKYCTP